MLIGGDDTSNDSVTLGTCFLMFVYNSASFRFALIGGNLTAQSTGSHSGKLSFLFPPPERPGEFARRLPRKCRVTQKLSVRNLSVLKGGNFIYPMMLRG